eukprot:1256725-Lingulodinium_polyedra.AAC.1
MLARAARTENVHPWNNTFAWKTKRMEAWPDMAVTRRQIPWRDGWLGRDACFIGRARAAGMTAER